MLILSGLVPSKEFSDEMIDKIYAKFTAYEKVANQKIITEDRFEGILRKVGEIKYPFDPSDEVVGRLVKFWLFPYLLWNV